MDAKEHEKVSKITLRYKVKEKGDLEEIWVTLDLFSRG
jgi:hypothetical protein